MEALAQEDRSYAKCGSAQSIPELQPHLPQSCLRPLLSLRRLLTKRFDFVSDLCRIADRCARLCAHCTGLLADPPGGEKLGAGRAHIISQSEQSLHYLEKCFG